MPISIVTPLHRDSNQDAGFLPPLIMAGRVPTNPTRD